MAGFLKTRWLLWLVPIVFVCFKIPQLHFPFYIDEGWVYAPAVKTMALNGPSLMPGAIPAEYSRGHPLMFHFLCALWMRCFGVSNTAIHSFPLLLFVIFLIALYEGCLRLFGKVEAQLVILMVSTRVIFFVQSSFIYPEIMLAMLTFLSLYYYVKDRLLPMSLMLFMLFLTKEGGLLFGAVIGVDAFISLFRQSDRLGRRLLSIVAIIVPTCLACGFYVLQKAKFGWYIFPEHTGLIKTNVADYYIMFKSALYWTFRGDRAMFVLVFFIILLSAIAAWRQKKVRYLFLCPPALIIYRVAEMFPANPSRPVMWMVLFVVCFTIPVYYLLRLHKTISAQAHKFIVLLGLCVVIFVFYSSMTVIAYRYMEVAIALVLVFLAVCINMFVTAGGKYLYYVAVSGVILIGAYGFYSNERAEDTELGAYRVMNVYMQEISFLEKENAFDKEIAYGCSWEMLRFTDTLEGFLNTSRSLTHMVHFPVGPNAQYALFGNSCGDRNNEEYRKMLANPNFHLVFKTKDGDTWAEIFKHN